MKKSFKDYAIYFFTLILGVSVFYMFNSLDAQQAMLEVSQSTHQIMDLLIQMISTISIFIAIILGFLIIYANNFLIKRRKKEFAIYMTLGMGKRKISKILLIETILIGIISLAVGLVLGIFASQLMSVIIGKLFEADMSEFKFAFSGAACIKTLIYFGVMYILMMLFNAFIVSKYKLIDLLQAKSKGEKIKIKNTFICVIVFLISIATLGWAYYQVLNNFAEVVQEPQNLLLPIGAGCVGTFLFFWSLSGFILKVAQASKTIYLKSTNMFVLRQLNAKINTTVVSMTIICLMLFTTIGILSTALSINNSMTEGMKKLAPADIILNKTNNTVRYAMDGSVMEYDTDERNIDNSYTIKEVLDDISFDTNKFKDEVDVNVYMIPEVSLEKTLGTVAEELRKEYPYVQLGQKETVMKVSDYNKVAKIYNLQQFELKDDEYIIVCNYNTIKEKRDKALQRDTKINALGKEYSPKYQECQDGFIEMSANPSNTGIVILPDSCPITEQMQYQNYFIANYNAETEEEKEQIEKQVVEGDFEKLISSSSKKGYSFMINTKMDIANGSVGVSALVTFIAMYLGIIFLIASSAILAIKELSESSDNKERYSILRKIGTDEKMINKALFMQIGIFFLVPLLLAIIHSIFGIQFALKVLQTIGWNGNLTSSIFGTAGVIVAIYGAYFLATYLGSKNIIKED